ncbi:5-methyltetrahydropteroyltriglutamate--homocysteine S-methyltransferase [Vagococcus entomophilus]|uniref:5-methyltetrahydropteroyltriglutamate--homocysteine methyltransferase n=1 Tax=Vagococcus entomophilus TaxID=1160095 RepID=A0A430AJB0_9ENTE|nr:5-methyltetrahydropteroyltriglutamate--homocysteine S-methyltransferase [Vagococcus entomophilus]RSU08181.1 5-methyltetrahydropteroyltriglutamate--homocysteine S-methyltransferase [Vagococcus entomophilus]
MGNVISSNLGYPRLGEKREWKHALEDYWSHKISQEEFVKRTKEVRLSNLKKQQELGIELIPVGDFSYYDHVLDTSFMFGVIPKRFQAKNEAHDQLDTYFSIARGTKQAIASEMTKWFNTNYHYIVPELEDFAPHLVENRPLKYYLEAKEELGIEGKPVLVGPITFLKLAKTYKEDEPESETSTCSCGHAHVLETAKCDARILQDLVDKFLPLYKQVLRELEDSGVEYVQLDEPILVTEYDQAELAVIKSTYQELQEAAPKLKIILQTYFESLTHYQEIVALPVAGIGLDFVHDFGENLAALSQYGFPKDKILAAGVIDGRNVWRSNLHAQQKLVKSIVEYAPEVELILQPSNSLLHVPVTKKNEPQLDSILLNGLSFADEKLNEIVLLTQSVQHTAPTNSLLDESKRAVDQLNQSEHRNHPEVQKELRDLKNLKNERHSIYNKRIQKQHKNLALPLLPTTTIGSFPQTQIVRQTRASWKKQEISNHEYEEFIQREIKRWIQIQEELELDVLVHGEFERTDMVEYFGQKLSGFVPTLYGWVQSYGSRAVRPPLVYGDVSFVEPITVKETVYAQSLTEKPVKGMLTAPITIINWSFVRDDIPKADVANQIGLALRKEVNHLEKAGIHIIQVDEPALREGLPLKKKRWAKYLKDAVYSFKLTTTGVKDETQIHTHMCYAEFEDIMETIRDLDADVISIETSRSQGEIIASFEEFHYDKEIGLGVYDIHSPRVPEVSEIKQNIKRALKVIPENQFWINPDCGLKTRKEEETIAALRKMVQATKEIRQEYEEKSQK